jgi:hypothetical protein
MCEREVKGVIIVEMRRKKKGERARMRGWQWEIYPKCCVKCFVII